MRRFKHWAYLNEEGMALFGDAFPNKMVPVRSMIPKYGPLGSPDSPSERYFIVQWDELKDKAQDLILETISEKQGATHSQLLGQIAEFGLPLRASLTNGSGTNHRGFFI